MKVIKLFRSEGSNFCPQYLTVHTQRFGLGVREIFEITCQKTQCLIPTGTPCHLRLHVNATGQVSGAATTGGTMADANVGIFADNGAQFSYANAEL